MSNDIQLLHQKTENFDIDVRIVYERVKIIQEHHHELEERVNRLSTELTVLDKRLSAMEISSDKSQDRWNKILSFTVQLAWVILAAWILTKLNLQSPLSPV